MRLTYCFQTTLRGYGVVNKYIAPTGEAEDSLFNAETIAINDYREQLDMAKQVAPINKYDFNRGFEYGVQWAIDNHRRGLC